MDIATIVTIVFSGLAAFFAGITFFYAVRSDKKRTENEIASKEAELKVISDYLNGISQNIDLPELRHLQSRQHILETELKRLKGGK